MSQAEFQIQRIYIKDLSFESPNSPDVFQTDWEPEIKLDLDTKSAQLDANTYEVVLTLTVTCKSSERVGFLCEVQQAGIFTVEHLNPPQLAHCLGAFCPNILFPYARETISTLVMKGSFPQLNLAPVNFDALYASHVEKSKLEQNVESETTVSTETTEQPAEATKENA